MTTRPFFFFPIFILLMVGLFVTGCGEGRARVAQRESDGRVVIEVWHGMGAGQGKALNEMAERFNASQTTYRAKPIYQGSYDSLAQKLIASLYARRNPAVSQMYPSWSKRYFLFDYLEPVANFVEKDPAFAAGLEDFYPIMLKENTLKNPRTGKEVLATLPFNKSVYVLYINQTLLEKLGWKQPPQTWIELKKLAEEMTGTPGPKADSPSMLGFGTRASIEDLTVQAYSANAQLLDEATGKLNLQQPAILASFGNLLTLIGGDNGRKQTGYVESSFLSNAFGSQRIGMYISSTASFTFNDRAVNNAFVWRAYRVPSREANVPGRTLMQGTNFGIFKTLAPEEKAGAWEFLKFSCSPAENARWAIATGYMPVRKSTQLVPEFAAYLEKNPSYKNAMDTLEFAEFEPRALYWDSLRLVIGREVDSVLSRRKTTEQAMVDAGRDIEAIRKNSE